MLMTYVPWSPPTLTVNTPLCGTETGREFGKHTHTHTELLREAETEQNKLKLSTKPLLALEGSIMDNLKLTQVMNSEI